MAPSRGKRPTGSHQPTYTNLSTSPFWYLPSAEEEEEDCLIAPYDQLLSPRLIITSAIKGVLLQSRTMIKKEEEEKLTKVAAAGPPWYPPPITKSPGVVACILFLIQPKG